MLVEKMWQKVRYGKVVEKNRGWFLFGIITLYIKKETYKN